MSCQKNTFALEAIFSKYCYDNKGDWLLKKCFSVQFKLFCVNSVRPFLLSQIVHSSLDSSSKLLERFLFKRHSQGLSLFSSFFLLHVKLESRYSLASSHSPLLQKPKLSVSELWRRMIRWQATAKHVNIDSSLIVDL